MTAGINLPNRRAVLTSLAGLGWVAMTGCSEASTPDRPRGGSKGEAAARPATMTVYRDPSCGCCTSWAMVARQAGYRVSVVDRSDMPAVKARLGVPEELSSCHTTVIAGYAVEGHVPMGHVARLLKDRPAGIRGIAVPGMPRGSPGMEMADGAMDAFDVLAFDAAGRATVFRT